jgi:Protein of unknown function (DUF3047)
MRGAARFICGCALWMVAVAAAAGEEISLPHWREDFDRQPPGWEVRRKPGAKLGDFHVENGMLVMKTANESGMLATHLEHVDLHQTPILRWRWRATTLPIGADGRVSERDDQAIAIYVSAGGPLRQKSIAYRWETDTPVGTEGEASYAAGIVKTKWTAVRNAKDVGSFFVEERNVASDFERAFGFVPEDISIGVTCNSQYTGTSAAAELDWIELLALSATPAAAETPTATEEK